jgi:YbbR domain-containing protein
MLRVLTAHWELKIGAVVVAFTLWFFVATSEHAQLGLATPVEYVGLAPELVVVTGQRESVDVQVRAVRSVVARLGPETMRVQVDLTGLREGDTVVQLTPSDVQLPPGATVTRIVPQVRGMPASGYTIRRVQVEPSAVSIKGPRSTIDARGEISTLPVDVSGSRRTVRQSVGLMLPASTYLTRERERTVQVTVEIAEDGMSQQQPGPRDARKKAAGR